MDSLRAIFDQTRIGATSAESRVREKLNLIAQKNPQLNALAIVNQNAAAEAAAIDSEVARGVVRGRLLGATFSTRLSVEVAGLTYSNGSIQEEPVISKRSLAIVEKLLAHGAVCLGKGNIAERGRSYFSENPRYGKTNHPFDPSRSPGGSGGGDAAAIAAGLVDFAIGADAGGSARIPANFCGLYALSATHGVLSESGSSHPSHTIMRLLKSIGVLARSLDDLEIIFALIEGYDSADSHSSATYLAPQKKSGKFIVCNSMNGTTPSAEIQAALKDTAARLEASGYKGTSLTPDFMNRMVEPFVILAAQAQLVLDDHLAKRDNLPNDPQKEGPHMQLLRKRLAQELPPLSAETLLYQWHQIDWGRDQAARLFQEYDFILMPVAATLPVAHGTGSYAIDGVNRRSEEVYQFSTVVNALGLPAIAFPVPNSAPLPVGLQLVGARFRERFLFNVLRQAGF